VGKKLIPGSDIEVKVAIALSFFTHPFPKDPFGKIPSKEGTFEY
jgi:hypothetical protein